MNATRTTRLFPNPAALIALFLFLAAVAGAQNFVNFEGKLTRPICLSPDGTRLFAVNTPDARLSVFDVSHPLNPFLIAEIPVGIEPVSVNARDNNEVWVVNEVSDSVSIVSVSNRLVVATLSVKDEPADVVFAGGRAFVSCARNNQIAVFDAATRAGLTNLPLLGENPRALAVNTNGTKVYVAFALSGNRTTLIPPNLAPPQPTNAIPPLSPGLPTPPQVGLIVDAADPAWTNTVIKYTMPDNDVAEIDVATLAVGRYFPRIGTVNFALSVQPGSGNLFVANTEARNLTRFEPNLRGFFETNRVSQINLTSGSVTHFDLNPGYDPTQFTLLDRTNALAQPAALVFGPSGGNFYLAAFGSDRIARVSAASGGVLARIELCPTAVGSAADARNKRGPRGLALKPGVALYVLNRIAGTISIINPTTDSVVREIPVGSYDPTPAAVRNGRGFLYDAKLSGNGTVSCASCHIDAEMDLLAWDLGDPQGTMGTNFTIVTPAFPIGTNQPVHPMKGPMTTQTLRGLKGLAPLHWRGDRTNFQHFNGAFASLLGGTPLAAADMQVYAEFVDTMVFQPNPNQNLDRTYPTNFAGGNAAAGRNTFFNEFYQPAPLSLACTTCHTGPPGPGSDRQIFARQALQESQDFKVPHLRNVYQKLSFNNGVGATSLGGFGITHDGLDPSLLTFLARPVFGTFATDVTRKNNLNAFVQCFDTGTAPAVGYGRTLVAANLDAGSVTNDWFLLEAQANGLTNIDLIGKGTIDGVQRGVLYQPGANNYKLDTTNATPLTHAQLAAKIQAGGTLTLMGVPPGAGPRMAIDRDLDGVLDGDVPPPRLQLATTGAQLVLNWPLGASGFNLEESPDLTAGAWSVPTNAIEIIGGWNFTTNNLGSGTKFFRLHQP